MKREEMSVFEIFQDPLLTIIALILLSTLWIIIPGEGTPPDTKEVEDNSPKPAQIQKEMDILRDQIRSLEEKIKELEAELKRIMDEIYSLSSLEEDSKKAKEQMRKQSEQLKMEVDRIKAAIQMKKTELKRLEDNLKQTKKTNETSKMKENEALKKLEEYIQKAKEEIAEKQSQLDNLIKEMEQAKRDLDKSVTTQKEKAKEADALQQKIKEQKARISELEREKAGLESNVEQVTKGGGFGTYNKVSEKDVIGIEAVNNKLVIVNDKNYDARTYTGISGNRLVSESEYTRKSSCISESVDRIKQESSEFQKEIKDKSKSHYLHFLVHEDSFGVFLAARQMAWQKGFDVAWFPFDEDKIYASSGGESPPVRSGK